jgi:hypothetical protein
LWACVGERVTDLVFIAERVNPTGLRHAQRFGPCRDLWSRVTSPTLAESLVESAANLEPEVLGEHATSPRLAFNSSSCYFCTGCTCAEVDTRKVLRRPHKLLNVHTTFNMRRGKHNMLPASTITQEESNRRGRSTFWTGCVRASESISR